MGGTSGRSRDNQMAGLINAYMPRASTRGGGALIAKAGGDNPITALAKVFLPKHDAPTPDDKPVIEDDAVASNDDPTSADEQTAAAVEETAPVVKTRKVKTVIVTAPKVATAQVVAAYAEPAPAPGGRPGQHRLGAVRLGDAGRLFAKTVRSPGFPRQDQPSRRPRSWPTPPASPSPSTRTA